MKYGLLLLSFFIGMGNIFAQQADIIYQKAKVSLIGKDIQTLESLGLEVDHGIYAEGRFLINMFTQKEVSTIRQNGFEVEVQVEDMVAHYQQNILTAPIEKRDLGCNESDMSVAFDYDTPTNYLDGSMGGYLTYQEMLTELNKMHSLYPELITAPTPISDFKTHENNDIYYLRISDSLNVNEDEPQVLYTALHHAREPNGLSQMIFYMWYLLENYETNDEIKFLVDHTDLHFIPCVNPDGYLFNESFAPQGGGGWRKNRRDNEDGEFGVDLNRNYGFLWGHDNNGSSPITGASTYRGPSPFSEAETQAVAFHCEANQFQVALNYHTFGNLLIHPWGYNDDPTEDDHIFKAIGSLMTRENNFHLGTGLETVGYLVNGDSDDWMYGEQQMKDKIYSLTPEVGSGFWPRPDEIDELNKSCMFQNLATAHVVHAYPVIWETSPIDFVIEGENQMEFKLSNVGFQPGEFEIYFEVVSDNSNVKTEKESFDLNFLDTSSLVKIFNLPAEIENSEVNIIAHIYQGAFETEVKFNTVFNAQWPATEVFSDVADAMDDWLVTDESWGLDDDLYFSGPHSFADSPLGEYQPVRTSTMTLLNETFIPDGDNAILQFRAKWEIETDYDYAQILISNDGENFTPLCGKYSREASVFQPQGEPVYDGIQDWVLEEIDISNYINQNIWIRFQMISDQFVQGAGINIDDVRIFTKSNPTTSTEWDTKALANIELFPNPTYGLFHIRSNSELRLGLSYSIVSGMGHEMKRGILSSHNQAIQVSDLPKGIYFVKIESGNQSFIERLILQ